MTLCWVIVAVTALCGMPTAGFALQDDSRDELYGDVVNPLTITVNDRDCTFVDIDDGKLEAVPRCTTTSRSTRPPSKRCCPTGHR